jgi:hypothetical protein
VCVCACVWGLSPVGWQRSRTKHHKGGEHTTVNEEAPRPLLPSPKGPNCGRRLCLGSRCFRGCLLWYWACILLALLLGVRVCARGVLGRAVGTRGKIFKNSFARNPVLSRASLLLPAPASRVSLPRQRAYRRCPSVRLGPASGCQFTHSASTHW